MVSANFPVYRDKSDPHQDGRPFFLRDAYSAGRSQLRRFSGVNLISVVGGFGEGEVSGPDSWQCNCSCLNKIDHSLGLVHKNRRTNGHHFGH